MTGQNWPADAMASQVGNCSLIRTSFPERRHYKPMVVAATDGAEASHNSSKRLTSRLVAATSPIVATPRKFV
jgi:hypothetical protein